MIILICFGCKESSSRWKDKRLKKELEKILDQTIDSVKNDPNAWQNRPQRQDRIIRNPNCPGRTNWNPKTWSKTDSIYMRHHKSGDLSIIYSFSSEHHGAEFNHIAVFNKKKNIERYFTNNQYIRRGLKGATDSSLTKILLQHYLQGKYIYNLNTGLISKCFESNMDTVYNVKLDDSVTLQNGETFYLSDFKVNIDQRQELYNRYPAFR